MQIRSRRLQCMGFLISLLIYLVYSPTFQTLLASDQASDYTGTSTDTKKEQTNKSTLANYTHPLKMHRLLLWVYFSCQIFTYMFCKRTKCNIHLCQHLQIHKTTLKRTKLTKASLTTFLFIFCNSVSHCSLITSIHFYFLPHKYSINFLSVKETSCNTGENLGMSIYSDLECRLCTRAVWKSRLGQFMKSSYYSAKTMADGLLQHTTRTTVRRIWHLIF